MSKIELSSYLADTLEEAKRLLKVQSELGRIPISKENKVFAIRIRQMIDNWFQDGPRPDGENAQNLIQERLSEEDLVGTFPQSDCIVDYSNLEGEVGEFSASNEKAFDSIDVGEEDSVTPF